METQFKNEYLFKIIIIGDSGVGKSSILHHYIYGKCMFYI